MLLVTLPPSWQGSKETRIALDVAAPCMLSLYAVVLVAGGRSSAHPLILFNSFLCIVASRS
jgi:hypothetical protein